MSTPRPSSHFSHRRQIFVNSRCRGSMPRRFAFIIMENSPWYHHLPCSYCWPSRKHSAGQKLSLRMHMNRLRDGSTDVHAIRGVVRGRKNIRSALNEILVTGLWRKESRMRLMVVVGVIKGYAESLHSARQSFILTFLFDAMVHFLLII